MIWLISTTITCMVLPNRMISHRQRIFVDTSALIGLLSNRDFLHDRSISIMTVLIEKNATLIASEAVLFELANEFSRTAFRQLAANFVQQIVSNSGFEVVWSTKKIFDLALGLYNSRSDKGWSLTDCVSFVIMKDLNIHVAFTSDKHFEQAGFERLLN
jgi:uncharacterized protein